MKKSEISKLINSYDAIKREIELICHNELMGKKDLMTIEDDETVKSLLSSKTESIAETVLSHSPIELVAAATNDLFSRNTHLYLLAIAVSLLSSRDHNNEFIKLCEAIGSTKNLYNQIVAYFDKPMASSRVVANDVMNDAMIESIEKLAQLNAFNLSKLRAPRWDTHAKIFFDAKLKQSKDIYEVLSGMEVSELCACFRFMSEYGHNIYTGEHIDFDEYYPLCILGTKDKEDARGFYKLLAQIKGPLIAQKHIDENSLERHCFLTLNDLSQITGEDIVSFVENGLLSDIDCYTRLIELTVSASRDEGRLAEIDMIKPKAIKKLLSLGIITPDDFDLMPNTMQRNIRLKLSSDFCL